MSVVVNCPACGGPAPADGGHWCANCGEFLWGVAIEVRDTVRPSQPDPDDPATFDGEQSPTNGAEPAPSRKPAAVIVPGAEQFAEVPLGIEPGKAAKLAGTIRNQSEIVDQFLVAVSGFFDWWTVDPPDGLHLLPFGAGDDAASEGEFTLHLAPPRSSVARAGTYEVFIVVTSAATSKVVERIRLLVSVAPFDQIELDIDPESQVRRRRAYFTCTIVNAGNHDTALTLYGQDPERVCRIRVAPAEVAIAAGAPPREARMEVMPVKPQLLGRQVDRPITFTAASGDNVELPPEPPSFFKQVFDASTKRASKRVRAEVKKAEKSAVRDAGLPKTMKVQLPSTKDAPKSQGSVAAPADWAPPPVAWEKKCTYTQRAWLAWWMALLLAAILIPLALVFQWFATRVAVPNVLAEGVSHARTNVDKKGLNGHEVPASPFETGGGPARCEPRTTNFRHTPGDVFKEVPAPGDHVLKGTTVTLCTYVRPGWRQVPNLYGLSPVAATQALANAGLTIGDIEPFPAPQGQVVVRQNPRKFSREFDAKYKEVRIVLGQLAGVPSIVGLPPADATQKLGPAGLVLGDVQPKHAPAGAVIRAQTPAAEHTVAAGNEVNVVLGLRVPKLTGLALVPAKGALRKAGLKPGKITPAAPPASDRVTRQAPRAGSIAPIGTHETLVLAAPKHKKAASKRPAGGKAVSVPSVAGATAAAAATQLKKAGVKTRRVRVISAKVPAGKLISTSPAPGAKVKKGSTVTLTVSAGYPEIAVDNGSQVLALNGATGKVVARIAAGPAGATQPSWSPQGDQIAYVSRGRIMLAPAAGPGGPRALTRAGTAYSLPTFPNSTTAPAVIATIVGGDKLCFLAVARPRPSCVTTAYSLGNEISWSPSGTELLVGGAANGGSAIGLVELTTRRPFATKAAAWKLHGFVTPRVGAAGVRAASFSPSGRRLAAAEDFSSPFSLALLSPTDLGFSKAQTIAAPTPVCSVQWRTDSQLVLAETSMSSSCATSIGALYVVDPLHPAKLSLIAADVEYPSWQPLPGVQ